MQRSLRSSRSDDRWAMIAERSSLVDHFACSDDRSAMASVFVRLLRREHHGA